LQGKLACFLRHYTQNGSGNYPALYSVGTVNSVPGDKAAGEWT